MIRHVFIFFLLFTIVLLIRSVQLFTIDNVTLDYDSSQYNHSLKYPVEFLYFKDESAFKLDGNYVYYVDYSKVKSRGVNNGKSYYPISIGIRGLYHYQLYIDNIEREKNLEIFFANANYLVDNISGNGCLPVPHLKVYRGHELNPGWCSAMAQGLAMSVISRAYEFNRDVRFYNAIIELARPFENEIALGGVNSYTAGLYFYHEYPYSDYEVKVLNGFMFSLLGLNDAFLVTGNKTIEEKYTEGLNTLSKTLISYNEGYWSLYSLEKRKDLYNHYALASPWYQKTHIAQLNAFCRITQDKFYCDYAAKFSSQLYGWFSFVIYPVYSIFDVYIRIKRFFN